ncbi:MAG: hypothetical protein ACRED6_05005 [Stellaceae bacterium]
MDGTGWRPLRGVDRDRLREARLQAHHALQWLARAARIYIPARPDDAHTNLGWDDRLDGFTTHALRDGVRLGLKIADLALIVLDNGGTPTLRLDGQRDVAVREWLGARIAALGFDPGDLDAPAPYTIPAHAVGGAGTYAVGGFADAFAELAAWFANANRALDGIRAAMAGRGFAASAVRCWPHHFDIATLATLDHGGDRARSVNAGLSPGDAWYDEPYFYVSPYPYPAAARLPPLPSLGHWHTRGFTAAIAPATRVLATRGRQAESVAFLRSAVDGAVAALN